jgi:hypothetical protein
MIEHGLSVQIDAPETRKILFIAGWNYTVKHDPVTALAEIVLKFHYQ